ncbi:OFA family MFS transporter, partial [Salmonella enterica subsp. enterica serovar Heidelberg]
LNYGFMYFGVAVGAVIAPYVTSAIAKYTGSYNTVFILRTVLLLIGVVLTLITKKYVATVLAKIH